MFGRQEVNDGRFEEFAGAPGARAYEYPPQFAPNAGHRGSVVTADNDLRICGIRGCAVATLILLLILAIMAPPAPAQVTSVVKLLSTPNPVVNTPVTFTAGVNWTATAPPSGTITLTDTVQCPGTSTATQTTLGTITLGSATSATPGAGTLVVSSFPCAGGNLIVANYSGDSNYSAGVSQPMLQTVLAQFTATSATLSSSLNPSAVGQSVTFTARLKYTLTGKTYPTGTVTFTDTPTGNALGTAGVQTSGGGLSTVTIASITTSSLAGGSHLIQAAYSGDNIYAPSTSQLVNQVVSFGITTGSLLPSGSTGTGYSQTLSASGGVQPYSWSLASGGLPPGLTLSGGGVISGIPTSAGTFNFTVRVTDSSSATATQSFALVIASGLTISSTSSLPSGSTGTSYSQTLSASGGMQPYSWALASGGLPPGLTLSGGGLISGTPTSAGTFNFTVRLTDSSAATATQVFILSVSDALAITTASLPPVKVGTVYSQTLAATGGHPPYTWSLRTGALATGLSLSSLGTISGTPANSGTFPFTVQVADSTSATATQVLSIVVTLTNAVSNVSAATYAALLAPESIAAAFGTDLATSAMPVTTLPLPTSFNGTTVKVKDSAGVERLAPLFYVGPTQVNYEIPSGTATGQATITVTSGDGTVSTGNINLTSVAPALFSANGDGQGPAAAVAIHAKPGGVQTHEFLAVLDSTSHKFVVSAIDLGPANEQVFVLLYGSGIRGRTSLANVTATIGDVPVPVAYAGAQATFVGLDQINLGPMPRSLIGAGVVNIILTVDSQAANTLQMDIK